LYRSLFRGRCLTKGLHATELWNSKVIYEKKQPVQLLAICPHLQMQTSLHQLHSESLNEKIIKATSARNDQLRSQSVTERYHKNASVHLRKKYAHVKSSKWNGEMQQQSYKNAP
jgi:hypothetical protein